MYCEARELGTGRSQATGHVTEYLEWIKELDSYSSREHEAMAPRRATELERAALSFAGVTPWKFGAQ